MMEEFSGIWSEAEREGDGFVRGLAVAVVTDNKDPEGLARVRVRLPWQTESSQSYWARLAVPMAMGDRGTFFLPEVEDEVLVGFEHGDLTHPCILGSLWNRRAPPPPNDAAGNNDLRTIRSRAFSEFVFDDGDKPSITLQMKDKRKVFINEDEMTLDDAKGNTITIHSKSGSISLESTTSIDIKSKKISIDAGGTMEIKASGTITVNGALVKIN